MRPGSASVVTGDTVTRASSSVTLSLVAPCESWTSRCHAPVAPLPMSTRRQEYGKVRPSTPGVSNVQRDSWALPGPPLPPWMSGVWVLAAW